MGRDTYTWRERGDILLFRVQERRDTDSETEARLHIFVLYIYGRWLTVVVKQCHHSIVTPFRHLRPNVMDIVGQKQYIRARVTTSPGLPYLMTIQHANPLD